MTLPVNGTTHLIPAYYSIYRPRKDERLSWPSWLTCSGWLTHISGHPSAAGRAQDRESSPARDRRSTTVPRHQLWLLQSTNRKSEPLVGEAVWPPEVAVMGGT